ncbi:hypothetical protein JTE90_011542 [Oedothorax gibbosus]|uniref:Uncharacterized protein n=1 Tax=Oedothorax gibbosus TaxID=931172 RepID=A0AAV6UJU8_9ARAC|nr:hypothetical protein JTE90_011542 [Oedothorax gibbosus]
MCSTNDPPHRKRDHAMERDTSKNFGSHLYRENNIYFDSFRRGWGWLVGDGESALKREMAQKDRDAYNRERQKEKFTIFVVEGRETQFPGEFLEFRS